MNMLLLARDALIDLFDTWGEYDNAMMQLALVVPKDAEPKGKLLSEAVRYAVANGWRPGVKLPHGEHDVQYVLLRPDTHLALQDMLCDDCPSYDEAIVGLLKANAILTAQVYAMRERERKP